MARSLSKRLSKSDLSITEGRNVKRLILDLLLQECLHEAIHGIHGRLWTLSRRPGRLEPGRHQQDLHPQLSARAPPDPHYSCQKLEGLTQGIPIIRRARRPPFRKVLEMDGGIVEAKELNHACAKLHAERQAFTSEFAQLCESEPDRTKKTKNAPAELQASQATLMIPAMLLSLNLLTKRHC